MRRTALCAAADARQFGRNRRNGGSRLVTVPWERPQLEVSPSTFERTVVSFLQDFGSATLQDFTVEHQKTITTLDGEFAMDGVATFQALGAEFVVLVECKHHKNPIKRELVQVLADKLEAAHAQKAMLFSTAPFQKGAIEYAGSRRIALVHFTQGGPVYETKGIDAPDGPCRPYDTYWVEATDGGDYRYDSAVSAERADAFLGGVG